MVTDYCGSKVTVKIRNTSGDWGGWTVDESCGPLTHNHVEDNIVGGTWYRLNWDTSGNSLNCSDENDGCAELTGKYAPCKNEYLNNPVWDFIPGISPGDLHKKKPPPPWNGCDLCIDDGVAFTIAYFMHRDWTCPCNIQPQ